MLYFIFLHMLTLKAAENHFGALSFYTINAVPLAYIEAFCIFSAIQQINVSIHWELCSLLLGSLASKMLYATAIVTDLPTKTITDIEVIYLIYLYNILYNNR